MIPYVHVDTSLAGVGEGHRLQLSDADVHHLRVVLRLLRGAAVEVADGTGRQAAAELEDGVARLVGDVTVVSRGAPQLIVAQSLPKGRKFDEVVREVTELGADAVIPLTSARSVTRLTDGRGERALARWDAIARSAAEQSRQPHRARVHAVTALDDLVSGRDKGLMLVAHPGAPSLNELLLAGREAATVTVAIGPEGGWTAGEIADLTQRGARTVGLGPAVLRTEHAAAAALAVLAAGTGRW